MAGEFKLKSNFKSRNTNQSFGQILRRNDRSRRQISEDLSGTGRYADLEYKDLNSEGAKQNAGRSLTLECTEPAFSETSGTDRSTKRIKTDGSNECSLMLNAMSKRQVRLRVPNDLPPYKRYSLPPLNNIRVIEGPSPSTSPARGITNKKKNEPRLPANDK